MTIGEKIYLLSNRLGAKHAHGCVGMAPGSRSVPKLKFAGSRGRFDMKTVLWGCVRHT